MIKACLDSLLINVVHALEIAKEAFEELSDATAVAFNWGHFGAPREWNNDLDQLHSFDFIYFIIIDSNIIIEITRSEVINSD